MIISLNVLISIVSDFYDLFKLLYLLSDGADPTGSIDEYLKKHKQYPTGKISMGEA